MTDFKGNLLVVDDKPANLRLLSRILAGEGYKVQPALNGQQALSTAYTEPPDLILLDLMMPEMDGYTVAAQLKADPRTQEIPIIFISALDAVDSIVQAFAAGGVDYILKPFRPAEVLARVQTHLALRALQRELQQINLELAHRNAELEIRNAELQEALTAIKTLSGIIPICAWCGRKIQNEQGQWVPVETYLEGHTQVAFTHGICPECSQRFLLGRTPR